MIAALLLAAAAAQAPEKTPIVAYAEVTGSIDPGSGDFLEEAIRDAQAQGVEALIVRLDTPGGLLSTTRDIVQAELSAKVPIVFWVGPPGARAGSAGVFLTLAANVAAMSPSSNIGAAHPVGLGGSGSGTKKDAKEDKDDGDTMSRKVENDTAAFVHGIAERRSRNVEWAEQAVRESVSITASKALELKVIDLVAEDLPELLQKLDGRSVDLGGGDRRKLHTVGAEIRAVQWTVKARVLHFLADPEIAYLIAMLGVIGILLEMYHPGTIIPGVVGVICLLIAAISFQMLPINVGALALVVLGVAFFVAEMYAGGHGGFIAAGTVCLVIGSLLLIGHIGSGFYADSDFGLGWRVVGPVGAAFAVIAGTLVYNVRRSAGRPMQVGMQGLVGQVAEVSEPIGAEDGSVLVHGELWRAGSAAPLAGQVAILLERGARVRVVSVEGLRVVVAPLIQA